MICFAESGLLKVMVVVAQLNEYSSENIGVLVKIGINDRTGEVISYFESDIGRIVEGTEVEGFPYIKIVLASNFEASSRDYFMAFRPILRYNQEWFEVYLAAETPNENYVCTEI